MKNKMENARRGGSNSKKSYGVIFDMDGVLVESYRPHFESWRTVAREYGHHMTEAQFAGQFGRTSREIIHDIWGRSVSDEQILQFDRRKEAIYRDLIRNNIPAVPGLQDLLKQLKDDGAEIAVGSSGPIENVDLVLDGLNIRSFFSAVVSARDVKIGKPDPEVFLLGAQKLGLPPNRCVVVEDAPAGIQAAHSGGMKVVALTTSYPAERISDADLVCRDLRDLNPEKIEILLAPKDNLV